jgi:hypothetical protein
MCADVYERNYAALGCCAEVNENVGRGLRTPVRKCAPTFTNVTMQHLVAAQKCTKMWAKVYERPFVNVRRHLRTHVRNRAALGCCEEVYERTFVNVG